MLKYLPSLFLALTPLSATAELTPQQQAQTRLEDVKDKLQSTQLIVNVDHHSLAKKLGVEMPPCRLLMFYPNHESSRLIAKYPLTALDLPYRFISYVSDSEAQTLATDSAWLKTRFDITNADELLDKWEVGLAQYLTGPFEKVGDTMANKTKIPKHYALLSLPSPYGFTQTQQSLEKLIKAQPDTVWFGSINFKKRAANADIVLPNCTLLLFGGPGPGGKAMANFPKLGLDAFCQKVLLLEDQEGKTTVYYNSISDLAKFHYGTHSPMHEQLDQRITATYQKALEQQ